jgi:hypothetical protein
VGSHRPALGLGVDRPDRAGGPARALALTLDGAPASDRPLVLQDATNRRWGTLAIEGAALQLRDAEDRLRISVTRLGPDAPRPDGALPLLVDGKAAFLVRALDVYGLPAAPGTMLMP